MNEIQARLDTKLNWNQTWSEPKKGLNPNTTRHKVELEKKREVNPSMNEWNPNKTRHKVQLKSNVKWYQTWIKPTYTCIQQSALLLSHVLHSLRFSFGTLVHSWKVRQLEACETLAVMYLQRGPPIAENKSTTHRTHRSPDDCAKLSTKTGRELSSLAYNGVLALRSQRILFLQGNRESFYLA